MKEGAPKGKLKIEIESKGPANNAKATVEVNNIWIMDDSVFSAGSIRISGMCQVPHSQFAFNQDVKIFKYFNRNNGRINKLLLFL